MNNKGFTLVELLAVIVILGIVMTIGGMNIMQTRQRMAKGNFENEINEVIEAASNYALDNKGVISFTAKINGKQHKYGTINVQNLISSGYYEATDNKLTHYLDDSNLDDLVIVMFLDSKHYYACIPLDKTGAPTSLGTSIDKNNELLKDNELNVLKCDFS